MPEILSINNAVSQQSLEPADATSGIGRIDDFSNSPQSVKDLVLTLRQKVIDKYENSGINNSSNINSNQSKNTNYKVANPNEINNKKSSITNNLTTENDNNSSIINELSPQVKRVIEELKKRDSAVRSHESAHQAVGGSLVRGKTLNYTVGPDGKQYAIGGEVKIDISEVPDNPSATISKMQQVRRAALAPVDPSAQDRSAASLASSIEAKADAELIKNRSEGISDNKKANIHPVNIYKENEEYPKVEPGKYVNLVNKGINL